MISKEVILDFNEKCGNFLEIPKLEDYKGVLWDFQRTGQKIYSIRTNELDFHKNWNSIMEVLNKISLLDFGWKVTSKHVNIYSHIGDPRGEFNCEHSINCPNNVLLDTVRTINQFLIWYEQNK